MSKLLFLILFLVAKSEVFQMFPDQTYQDTTPSTRACYANCQFCQIKTQFCEECLSPYFQKDSNGDCVLINGYTIESSEQQLLTNGGFLPSNISWSNSKTTMCNPGADYFSQNLKVLGPFGNDDGTITYKRSVSSHKYMKVKFLMLKMGWTQNDSLTIIIRNQDNILLSNETMSYIFQIPNQNLCSESSKDQRFSVEYDIQNIGTTTIIISFVPRFSTTSVQWALSTYLLLTGQCNETCDDCYPSLEGTQCKSCKNFFVLGMDGTCSQCADGFKLINVNGVGRCEKCGIDYKSCETNNEVCWYKQYQASINSTCTWNSNRNYVADYYIESDQFTSSLFTVNGASSIFQCANYTLVGLANRGQMITRIFTTLAPHQQLSFTFNFIIIDQVAPQKCSFEIYLDNIRIENLIINTAGVSNICGGDQLEVFQTYPATKFYTHNNTQNVNFTIRSSNTAKWGIRNFKISRHVCDESCLQCGVNGCITCNGILSLNQLNCSSCPLGSSLRGVNNSICYSCQQNCLSCAISTNGTIINRTCTKCKQGYFVFEGKCEILPNVGSTITDADGTWKSMNQIVNDVNCSIDFKDAITTQNTQINFLVTQNMLTNTYSIIDPHYKILISFYLLKIDHWGPQDQLHLYFNDLLVLRKKYSDVGNRICSNPAENDLVSYEQIEIEDNNETLTAYFEVVNANNTTTRKFGIANFSVNPVACQQCQSYDFQFKVDYNYDSVLTVLVMFNRLYINNDPQLFQTIFKMQVNGQRLNYKVIKNDSIRYFLEAYPDSQLLLSNVTVYCQYPHKVTTNIYDPINQNSFFTQRILQQISIDRIKSLSNQVSSKVIERYTPLESPSTAEGFRVFFEVVSRMVIYIGFFSFFIGCMTPCTHFMHNIQKLWFHIYVASLALPSFLKIALKGFRESQDQNIVINPSKWQSGIPKYLYYEAPLQYQDYYQDITFFRNIYNVAFAAALYLTFSILAYLLFRFNKVGGSLSNKFWRHMKITFYRRPFFVFNSVIFYQYLTACMACTLQFIDLTSKTKEDPFRELNAAASIITFILITIYPLISFFYLSQKQKEMYSTNYELSYRNRYHEIFYRFLPRNLWKMGSVKFIPLGFKQRFYNLVRFGQLWWFSIIFALMHGSGFSQAFLLMVGNSLHLTFLWISDISYTWSFKILKVLELLFFLGLEVIILVVQQQNGTLTKDAYNALGMVGVAFVFVIILISFVRFIYTLWKLIGQYRQSDSGDDIKDQRLRNDDFYSSFHYENQKIISNFQSPNND